MITYTFSTETFQVSLKGESTDIEALNRIKASINGAHSRARMNYKPDILSEKIQSPTVKDNSCELVIQCKDFDGVSEVVSILTDKFESEGVVYEKDIRQESSNQKLTSSLNYYEAKSKASLTNKVLPEEESKTNHDNINNQNRPSNNSF